MRHIVPRATENGDGPRADEVVHGLLDAVRSAGRLSFLFPDGASAHFAPSADRLPALFDQTPSGDPGLDNARALMLAEALGGAAVVDSSAGATGDREIVVDERAVEALRGDVTGVVRAAQSLYRELERSVEEAEHISSRLSSRH